MKGGFTLVEVMVALVLLSLASIALVECLIVAQHAQVESGRWMRAMALAEEGLERARAGNCVASEVVDRFSRACVSSGDGGLQRIEVAVRWMGKELRLATLVRP